MKKVASTLIALAASGFAAACAGPAHDTVTQGVAPASPTVAPMAAQSDVSFFRSASCGDQVSAAPTTPGLRLTNGGPIQANTSSPRELAVPVQLHNDTAMAADFTTYTVLAAVVTDKDGRVVARTSGWNLDSRTLSIPASSSIALSADVPIYVCSKREQNTKSAVRLTAGTYTVWADADLTSNDVDQRQSVVRGGPWRLIVS